MERLKHIFVSCYGTRRSIWNTLQAMTDKELIEAFSTILQDLLQAKRSIKIEKFNKGDEK